MSDYIKKLRACIRWYMELEDGYLAEQEKLRGAMDSENTRHTELGNESSIPLYIRFCPYDFECPLEPRSLLNAPLSHSIY